MRICCYNMHSMCPTPCVGCSLIEQKIDQLDEKTAENTRRLLNREDTALQYKRCIMKWT